MTARKLFCPPSRGRLADRTFHFSYSRSCARRSVGWTCGLARAPVGRAARPSSPRSNGIIRCIMNIDRKGSGCRRGDSKPRFFENPAGKRKVGADRSSKAQEDQVLPGTFASDPHHCDFETSKWICAGTSPKVEYIGSRGVIVFVSPIAHRFRRVFQNGVDSLDVNTRKTADAII